METKPLPPELLRQMDAYWRAANYLSVGQIYLYDNPLLKRPLTFEDVKHMLLGHRAVSRSFVPPPPEAQAEQEATGSTGNGSVSWLNFIHEIGDQFMGVSQCSPGK